MEAISLRNGVEYQVGDRVEVPDPNKGDGWSYSFVGRVASFEEDKGEVSVLIQDSSGETLRINPYRLRNLSMPVFQARTTKDVQ